MAKGVQQQIFRERRSYNQWVNNQTLEDYALRFTAKKARKWSLMRVANTALGAISFLALEAIGGAITLSYGFEHALAAILVVSAIIFLAGIPICYYAAKYGVDIDLLTRGAGFGYIGSTTTSLIYASFTFIFFALEAAIMAVALEMLLGIPLAWGYVICSIVVIPLVTHGITFISQFQLWTQPVWVLFQILPFIYILSQDSEALSQWTQFHGLDMGSVDHFSVIHFGAACAVMFALIAQIGEQVDYLRFLPPKTAENRVSWWTALISAGPGWIIIGAIKILAGSLLAVMAFNSGISADRAADPTQMYVFAFGYMTISPEKALLIAACFVILSQLKINVTNSYAGSIAWSNFFSRLTHSHPGRVVWLVFNVVIALMLMELGVYQAFEDTLGVYAIVAVAWVGTLVADLVINKPLKLSPAHIEFKRAHLYDINPVGVGSMLVSSILGIVCFLNIFGDIAQALAHFITLGTTFLLTPLISYLTRGKFYIARTPDELPADVTQHECIVCQNNYEVEDVAFCPAYDGPICSLCCSLDSRCQDMCKDVKGINDQIIAFLKIVLPQKIVGILTGRFVQFTSLLVLVSGITGALLALVYSHVVTDSPSINSLLATTMWKVYLILIIVAGVISWLFVLAHESRLVAQSESQHQNILLSKEIEAHKKTDRELQRAKEQAEAANNAKSRYLIGISHELRTPLNSILGYAQLLENDDQLVGLRKSQVSVIKRSGEHLSDLIEGLLDISKIEAGRLQIHRDQVAIKTLMDQIVYMFRLQASEKGLNFTYTCKGSLPDIVSTDEKRLRQILINLLSNAIKFTTKGSVHLNLSYKNQVAKVEIIDTGVGIPESERERIFRPFERLRSPDVPPVAGTGLGLAIVRLLLDIMGGEIEVSSPEEGGTKFTFWLMLSPVSFPEDEPTAHKTIYGYHGDKKAITVVDDDPGHRGLVSDLLSPLGFIVLEAMDGEEFLARCEEFKTDLLLLDISMPGLSGWEVAQELRHRGFKYPIVMVSANAYESDNELLESNLCNDYLVKPIKLEILLEKISYLLGIEWDYDDPTKVKHKQSANSILLENTDTLPDGYPVKKLLDLAEIGHLSGLMLELKQLDHSLPLTQKIAKLVDEVRLDELLDLLRKYHASER